LGAQDEALGSRIDPAGSTAKRPQVLDGNAGRRRLLNAEREGRGNSRVARVVLVEGACSSARWSGSPFGAAATVRPDGGSTDGGSAALTGYSIVDAPDLAAAAALAKGCPLLGDGGSVDVY
jgi:hypothetical protein